jgi:hypothetical protein
MNNINTKTDRITINQMSNNCINIPQIVVHKGKMG